MSVRSNIREVRKGAWQKKFDQWFKREVDAGIGALSRYSDDKEIGEIRVIALAAYAAGRRSRASELSMTLSKAMRKANFTL